MATWIFEPGHTEVEFRARHMMVSWVRGLFKDIHGRLELDWDQCLDATAAETGGEASARVHKPPKAFRRRCSPDLRAHQMVLSQILDVLDGAEPVFGADAEFHISI